ncbi:MAG: hypothetical protein EBQ56_07510 [Proteobacteria bacterium]|nr:hypothetical protein [Pseudomonadota bacterium]
MDGDHPASATLPHRSAPATAPRRPVAYATTSNWVSVAARRTLPEVPTRATKIHSATETITARITRQRAVRRVPPNPASHVVAPATMETLYPEIAIRWLAPVVRNASLSHGGRSFRSPSRMPTASDASGSGR